MFDHEVLDMQRFMKEHVRELLETSPADEALANRLQRVGDELAEIEKMARRSRSKAAEGMWAVRRALRQGGVKVPPLPRPPGTTPEDRGIPGAESIVFSSALAGACVACAEEVGAGPIGWSAEPEGPLCDDCLNDRSVPLRVALLLANLMRELVEMDGGSDEEARVARMLLGTAGTALEQSIFWDWPPGGTMTEEELIRVLEEIGEAKTDGGDR